MKTTKQQASPLSTTQLRVDERDAVDSVRERLRGAAHLLDVLVEDTDLNTVDAPYAFALLVGDLRSISNELDRVFEAVDDRLGVAR